MLIEQIILGSRVRKDMGDLSSLAESMKRHGLLHPVVVKSDNTLIAGQRRIEAAKLLGWNDVPVTVIDVADLLSAERDENAERKDFTPTEAVAIGRLIEEQHREKIAAIRREQMAAAGRKSAALKNGTSTVQTVDAPAALGSSDKAAGNGVGMDAGTYFRAKKVVSAAEENPELYGDLPIKMDETRNISGTYEELRARKRGKSVRNPALNGMRHLQPNREVERATVSLEGICEVLKMLKVAELDADKRSGWAKSLSKSASIIKSTARRLHG